MSFKSITLASAFVLTMGTAAFAQGGASNGGHLGGGILLDDDVPVSVGEHHEGRVLQIADFH
ncbi:hypothetical protein, partial [Methylobacterium sp. WL116]|uniref:hypothetical protein n=1 Tax=Methylobacterium sp. WL116 TaxID=2603889 RepID=UPI0011C754D9